MFNKTRLAVLTLAPLLISTLGVAFDATPQASFAAHSPRDNSAPVASDRYNDAFGSTQPDAGGAVVIEGSEIITAQTKNDEPVNKNPGVAGDNRRLKFEGGLINGVGHTYRLDGPPGWSMSTESGRAIGLPVVFTPADTPGPDFPYLIYSQIMERKGRDTPELIKAMVKMFKPNEEMSADFEQPPIDIDSRESTASVRNLPPGADGHFEKIAFIEEKDWTVMVILVSDTKSDLDLHTPEFVTVVKSYEFGGQSNK